MRKFLALGPVALLAACATPTPNPGVGFGPYDQYAAQREAVLTGQPVGGFGAPGTVPTSPYGLATPTTPAPVAVPAGGIPSSSLAAAGIGVAPVASAPIGAPLPANAGSLVTVASSGVAGDVNTLRSTGLEASPSNAAPVLVGAAPVAPTVPSSTGGISDEQDFEAVSSRETIESDAARRAAQAAQYQVVQPQALPPPPADTGPNIVEYALNAPNSKGQEWYSRFAFAREGRMLRNCAGYATPDDAQRDFLARGGPERDARGLDPDGDGFACAWDPAPFRAAVGRN